MFLHSQLCSFLYSQEISIYCAQLRVEMMWLLFSGYSFLFLKVGQFTLSIVLVLEIEMVVSWFGHYIFENVVL